MGPDITPYRVASSIDVYWIGIIGLKERRVYGSSPVCYSAQEGIPVGMAPDYILVEGQTFSKAKLSLDNHVYKNCAIDDCDVYFSGGQYELLDTHITNSRLILNHPAKGMYNAVQIFKMKSPGSSIIFE